MGASSREIRPVLLLSLSTVMSVRCYVCTLVEYVVDMPGRRC